MNSSMSHVLLEAVEKKLIFHHVAIKALGATETGEITRASLTTTEMQ